MSSVKELEKAWEDVVGAFQYAADTAEEIAEEISEVVGYMSEKELENWLNHLDNCEGCKHCEL